jgi:predicted TIM-barrel enzyme
MSLPQWIAVVQLPPLVGAPQAEHQHPAEILQDSGFRAVQEAQDLVKAGFDAVLLQNRGDAPYFHSQVPSETVACLSIIAAAVREAVRVPLGVQVLGNDSRAALAIASVVGGDFIRVGLESPRSSRFAALIRERERLHAPVAILGEPGRHASAYANQYSGLDLGLDGWVLSREEIQYGLNLHEKRSPLYLDFENDDILRFVQEAQLKVQGVIFGSVLRKGQQEGAPLDLKKAKELLRDMKKLMSPSAAKSSKKGKSRKK